MFWNKRKVLGHMFLAEQNKMILYFDNGAIEEIAQWKDCSCKLGSDWVLATKKHMEEQAGQAVPLKVKS